MQWLIAASPERLRNRRIDEAKKSGLIQRVTWDVTGANTPTAVGAGVRGLAWPRTGQGFGVGVIGRTTQGRPTRRIGKRRIVSASESRNNCVSTRSRAQKKPGARLVKLALFRPVVSLGAVLLLTGCPFLAVIEVHAASSGKIRTSQINGFSCV